MSEEKELKVVVCIPGHMRDAGEFFLACWTKLHRHLLVKTNGNLVCKFGRGIYLHEIRNKLFGWERDKTEDFKPWNGEIPYTHILNIDMDMVFEPWMFDRLVERDVDIIAGDYPVSSRNKMTASVRRDSEKETATRIARYPDQEKLGDDVLFRVDFVGMGFMLIKKGVVESIKAPWFDPIFLKDSSIPLGGSFSGEDTAFCTRLRRAGIPIYVDMKVTRALRHEKLRPLGIEDMIPVEEMESDSYKKAMIGMEVSG